MIEHVANWKQFSGYVRVFAQLRRLVSGQEYDVRNKFLVTVAKTRPWSLVYWLETHLQWCHWMSCCCSHEPWIALLTGRISQPLCTAFSVHSLRVTFVYLCAMILCFFMWSRKNGTVMASVLRVRVRTARINYYTCPNEWPFASERGRPSVCDANAFNSSRI